MAEVSHTRTVVRVVVMATKQVSGRDQNSTPRHAKTPESIVIKICMRVTSWTAPDTQHFIAIGSGVSPREYTSREVTQSPIYVILHSLLEVSFCTQPFPTPSGGLWSLWFLTLVVYVWRPGNGWDGKGKGEEREEGMRGRKKGEAACPTNKKSFLRPWSVSINLAARLKCYRGHDS